MDKDGHGYSPHMNVEGSDGYSEGNPHLNASNVNSREDMSSNPLHQPHRIEKLLENTAEIGILTKLKDNEEARSHAVKKVYDETKVSLGVICPKNLPNDLSEREEKINVFKTEVNKERDTIKEKEEKVQKDLKELIQKYNSIEQKALNEANSDLLALQEESKQILEKIRELEIEKYKVQGSNYQDQLSQQTQDLSKSTDESCSKLQEEMEDMSNILNNILKDNQSKFNEEAQPLLEQAPHKISDMPTSLSSIAAPLFAEFNPKLKEDFDKLLADAKIPEEKKEYKQKNGIKKPEEFLAKLKENPEYNKITLSEDSQSEENSKVNISFPPQRHHASSTSFSNISEEEHDYTVSPLQLSSESASKESKSSSSHSKRVSSLPPEDSTFISHTEGHYRSDSVEATGNDREDAREENKEQSTRKDQTRISRSGDREEEKNNELKSGGDEEESEQDSKLTDREVYEGGEENSSQKDDESDSKSGNEDGRPNNSVSSVDFNHSEPTNQSEKEDSKEGVENIKQNQYHRDEKVKIIGSFDNNLNALNTQRILELNYDITKTIE